MKKYVSYTENQIFNDEPHFLLFNMIADCINNASDHRIIVDLGEKPGVCYFMIDFQDAAKSNKHYTGKEGSCCCITYESPESDDVEYNFCGSYETLYQVLDIVLTIVSRGFDKIYTKGY